MTLATSDAREKAALAIQGALGLNLLEAALAASAGDTPRAWAAAALTAATYYVVFKNLDRNAVAARNGAVGLAVAHGVLAAASIPVHPVFFLEVAVAGCLAWGASQIRKAVLF